MKIFFNVLLFAAVVVSATSCVKERFWGDSNPVKKGEAEVLLRLKAPGGYSSSPKSRALSIDDENTLDNIYVLAFDNTGHLADIRKGVNVNSSTGSLNPAVSGTGSFVVNLKASANAGDTYTLVVLANAEAILQANSMTEFVAANHASKSYSDVANLLTKEIAAKMYSDGSVGSRIAMWGEIVSVQITGGENAHNVSLTRTIARIDVGVGKASKNGAGEFSWTGLDSNHGKIPFELTSVYVIKPQDEYAIIPTVGNFSGGIATAPSVPSGSYKIGTAESIANFRYNNITGSTDDSNGNITGSYTTRSIYVPESDILMGAAGKPGDVNHTNRMAIVVGGFYNGSTTETFYRLDFAALSATTNKKELMNVLRNHLYQFNISSVSGAGYADPETAYNSLAMNMTVDIYDWNEPDLGDIEFDDTHYFSISDRRVVFSPFGNQTTIVTIKTNVTNFEMWELDRGGRTLEMKGNGTGDELTYGPFERGYQYTLARVGTSDIYKLTIVATKHNVSNAVTDRVGHWEIIAGRMNIPFEVDQQWTKLYISVTNGQLTRLYPEGTDGAVIPINIMSMVPVTVTSSGSWVKGVHNVTTSSGGLYTASLALTVDPFKFGNGADEDGTDNRSSSITITSQGEEPVIYTITQERPYIKFSRTNEYISRPAPLVTINTSIDVFTNVMAADLSLNRTAGNGTGNEKIQLDGTGMVGVDALRPRYRRFTIEADLRDIMGISNGFNATFTVTPTVGKYGSLAEASVNVVVPSAGSKFTPFWHRASFNVLDNWSQFWPIPQTQYTTAIGVTNKDKNLIFPWNTTSVEFDMTTNAGSVFEPLLSSVGSGVLIEGDSYLYISDPAIPYTFIFNNTNYNNAGNYHLTLTVDKELFPLRSDQVTFNFRQGVQYWSRTTVDNSGQIGYKGHTEVSPAEITVTNNTLWSYEVGSWDPPFPTDWLKVRAASEPFDVYKTAKQQDDRLYAPVMYDGNYTGAQTGTGLTKATQFQLAIAPAGGHIIYAPVSPEQLARTAVVTFTNNSIDAIKNGANISNPTITVRQYSPRIYWVSETHSTGMPTLLHWQTATTEKIPGTGGYYDMVVNTNLSDWGIKVYIGTDNTGTELTTVSGTSATNDRTGEQRPAIRVIIDNTTSERTLSFYLFSTESGLTKADNAANEIKIAQVVQKVSLIAESGNAAPRIFVLGTGDDAKLMLTQNPTNYGAYFQWMGTSAWVYSGSDIMGDAVFTTGTGPKGCESIWAPGAGAAAVHTVASLKTGKGDPCKLLGYTKSEITTMLEKGELPDNKQWRLPINSGDGTSNATFGSIYSDWKSTGGINGRYFGPEATLSGTGGQFLPAAGYGGNGSFEDQRTGGLYWSSTFSGGSTAYNLTFSNLSISPQRNYNQALSFSIRCVAQ